jgi:hypothetical protein
MKRVKQYGFFIVVLVLLVGCDRPEAKLHKQLIGTWMQEDSSFEMTLSSNGLFHSKYVGEDKELAFVGTWFVSNSSAIITITGKDVRNWPYPTNTPSIGNVESDRIISVDAVRLVTEFKGQTNSLVRKSQVHSP